MAKKNSELISKFSKENEHVQHLSIEQIKDIVHAPWRFLKKQMEGGDLNSVRFKYFGEFRVHPRRVEMAKESLEINLEKGYITQKRYEELKIMFENYLKYKLMDNKDVLVILDYGHGGLDPESGEYVTPGKRSPNWTGVTYPLHNKDIYYEGVGNAEIGKLIEEELKGLGINYAVLRDGYEDIPLRERCSKANMLCGNKCFGISIHSNAGGGKNIEVFTSPGDTPADPMATLCIEVFKEVFPEFADGVRTDYRDGDPDKEERFGMLTGTKMPFFLPEAFFMDNEGECRSLLMTKGGKERIADWHVKTIVRIINELY